MDETNVNPADQQTQSDKAKPAAEAQSDLSAQLGKLNENINALLKSVLDTDQRKKLEKQISTTLDQLNKQLNKAVEQVRIDTAVKQAKSRVEEAWTTAHGPQILKEMKAGVADTLKAMSAELNKANPLKQDAKDKPMAGDVKPVEEVKAAVEAVVDKVEEVKPPEA